MGLIDVIFVCILALGFISGLQKGLLASVLACVAMGIAFAVARLEYSTVCGLLDNSNLKTWLAATQTLEDAEWTRIFNAVSYTFIFLIADAALLLVVNLINNVFRLPKLRGADGLLGGVLGIFRAALIVMIVVELLQLAFSPFNAELVENLMADSVLGDILSENFIFSVVGI